MQKSSEAQNLVMQGTGEYFYMIYDFEVSCTEYLFL